MTLSDWVALAHLTARLSAIAGDVPGLPSVLRRRIDTLGRAVGDQDVARLASFDGAQPPREVDAWWDERATEADLPEVAVWLAENAARRFAIGERAHLQSVVLAVEEWGKIARRRS